MSDLTGADLCGIERDYPTSTPAGRTIAALVAALRQARAERDTLQKQLERAQGAEADLAAMLIRAERAEADRDGEREAKLNNAHELEAVEARRVEQVPILAAALARAREALNRVVREYDAAGPDDEGPLWDAHKPDHWIPQTLAFDPLCAAALAHERNREAVIRAAARLVTSWHPDSMGHDTMDAEDGLRAALARLREEDPR